jgi:hypothetical protein
MLEKTKSIIERLKRIENARENVDEAQVLADLKSNLDIPLQTLSATSESLNILLESGVGISLAIAKESAEVLESVQKVSEKFLADPKSTTLKVGRRWTSLVNKLEDFGGQYSSRLVVLWQSYFDEHLFSGLAPERQRAVLGMTLHNEEAIKEYEELWRRFIAFRGRLPSSKDEVSELQGISAALGMVEFEEDVPEEVMLFIDASRSGAPLSLVTEVVRTWLTENDLMDMYTVRARHH